MLQVKVDCFCSDETITKLPTTWEGVVEYLASCPGVMKKKRNVDTPVQVSYLGGRGQIPGFLSRCDEEEEECKHTCTGELPGMWTHLYR